MKTVRNMFLSALLLVGAQAMADEGSLMSDELKNYVAYGAIMTMLVLFVITMLVLLRTFKVLSKLITGPEGKNTAKTQVIAHEVVVPEREKQQNSLVNKLLSLRPMSEEEELLTEHDYDGIRELDNPTPAWFMVLFYATIIFAVGYMLIYHVFGLGQLQYQEYAAEMAIAKKEKEAYLATAGNLIDETSVTVNTNPDVLSAGQAIFAQNCSPCHGDKGQGVVGPNLTDEYWLHGGKINDIFKTIKYGVASKGMPNWDKQLSPKQIADVSNYVKSIYGTHPAGAKPPEGEKESAVEEAETSVKTAMLLQNK